MVLSGAINKELVSWISKAGGKAVGISGKDGALVTARKVEAQKLGKAIEDPDSGEAIGYSCAYGPRVWQYLVVSAHGRVTTSFPIQLRDNCYNHDFAVTRKFSICFDGNLVLGMEVQATGSMWRFLRDRPGEGGG